MFGVLLCGLLLCNSPAVTAEPQTPDTPAADRDSPAAPDGSPAGAVPSPRDAAKIEFFRDKVLPLLQSRCFECHGPKAERKGGLALTGRTALLTGGDSGPALVPFRPEESLLISAIRYESFEMPPRSRMPDAEIAILERWITEGAIFPTDVEPPESSSLATQFPLQERKAAHWAWQPIRPQPIPQPKDTEWAETDIDRFVLEKLEQRQLVPPADADRRAILRRLCFDLIGLPPSLELQDQFLNDPADTSTAMARVTDELLNSPRFGERWARHWLDLVRYAETLGHEFDYPLPHAWQYRDYVIRAINADVPYDQFVTEHIAGDLLPEPRRNSEHQFDESVIGTGFWFLGEDKHAPVDVKGEEASRVDNQIDVFSKTFLGLTVACARCHDHKFDAITTADYYALSGYLQSSRRRLEWLDLDGRTQQWIDQLNEQQAKLSALLTRQVNSATSTTVTARILEAISRDKTTDGMPDTLHRLSQALTLDTTSRPDNGLSLAFALAAIPADQRTQPQSIARAVHEWCDRTLQTPVESASDAKLIFADFRNTTSAGKLPAGWLAYGPAFSQFRNHRDVETHTVGDTPHGLSDEACEQPPVSNGGSDESRDVAAPPTNGLTAPTLPHAIPVDWQDNAPVPAIGDRVSSAELSPGLKGVLQSPTFELLHPEILILAKGTGCRVRLVIDGYVMNEFSELLFRGAKQPIETDGEYRWLRLDNDTHRYIGHKCHLEFLDEGSGWFAVREVRFVATAGDAPPPAIVSSSANRALAEELKRDPRISTEPPAEDASTFLSQIVGRLSTTLIADPSLLQSTIALRLLSEDFAAEYQASARDWAKLAETVPADAAVLVMCDGTSEDEHVFIRGSHRNLGPIVPRRFLEALPETASVRSASEGRVAGSARLLLARQVLADENPLTARVAVNRVWQHLFGVGIVPSSDNFGVLGERPSHPELLDHLADEFRRDGWSVKRLIRRLVLSHTYRISSLRDPTAELSDPNNRLLHRARIRRLEGEVIRDAMLTVSGRLDTTSGGPPVPVYLTPFMQGRGRPGASGPLDGNGRRSIYQSVNRNFLSPFMLAFDTPTPATAVGRRSSSNVPAQALILLNSEFVTEQSGLWAARLVKENHESLDSLLDSAFRQAFCRLPSSEERTFVTQFAEQVAADKPGSSAELPRRVEVIADICHVLLNQKEFVFLD